MYENELSIEYSDSNYYLVSNMYINKKSSYVYFNIDNIIDEISFKTFELKSDYSDIDDQFLYNRIFKYETNP